MDIVSQRVVGLYAHSMQKDWHIYDWLAAKQWLIKLNINALVGHGFVVDWSPNRIDGWMKVDLFQHMTEMTQHFIMFDDTVDQLIELVLRVDPMLKSNSFYVISDAKIADSRYKDSINYVQTLHDVIVDQHDRLVVFWKKSTDTIDS